MSRDRYLVEVCDYVGLVVEHERSTFYETLSTAKLLRQQYPRAVVQVTNLDRSDYDTDGLTDEQREQLSEVL